MIQNVIPNTDITVSPPVGTVFVMDTEHVIELAETWCHMWNEDSALAYQLMTDDCVQWFASAPDLDSVVGPAQQEVFVTEARARLGNVFVPRLYVIDDGMFAYLWDVTSADGTVLTGIDVNVLQGGKIRENWTFPGPHRTVPDPSPGKALDRNELTKLGTEWAAANGYAIHREMIIDAPAGRIALLRTTSGGIGGVDLLTVRDRGIEPIWSITGARGFRY